jgi:hypothetical protein
MKLSERFEEALIYATRAHCNQTRKKTGIPYIAHILGVTAIALEYGANETEAIGALLHDTVEDCGGAERLRDIRKKFGDDVASIVDGCTDTDQTPKPPWLERKRAYIEHLKDSDSSTRLVSASDKLHNTRARSWLSYEEPVSKCSSGLPGRRKAHFGITARLSPPSANMAIMPISSTNSIASSPILKSLSVADNDSRGREFWRRYGGAEISGAVAIGLIFRETAAITDRRYSKDAV